MTKRLLSLVSVAVAAGTVLLTACGQGAALPGAPAAPTSTAAPASTAAPTSSTSASTAPATSTSGALSSAVPKAAGKQTTPAPAGSDAGQPGTDANGVQPVNCGPTQDGSGRTVSIIADATPAGLVGCTEAFDVVDQYLKNADKAQGSSRNLDLGNGWSCSTDGGSGPDQQGIISCSGGITGGMSLHTQP